ncbi:TspO/MBR family protein [Ornithinimicrobium pratense]|uniref:Tryptophan-rich sensory protein n=1 Tax=Ornithinimicrobium pratense TaxID=2593973 RepID=A0A5J6V2N2_9MICO|nr:TspO/MBR family protein [Ornithinimicrobium pratense]QFG67411.1 tryptophan-rich sensory protein [Ornithinimicrobium pratense]
MSTRHASASSPPASRPSTLRRDQILVSVAAVVWLVGTLLGTGLIGTDDGVSDQGDGLFTDSTTLIAPDGPAFSIWSVIYVLLGAYVIWQWVAADSRWAAVTRLPAAVSIALNGIWLMVVFADWVLVSVLVILGIAASLGFVLARTATLSSEGWAPAVFVSLTFGLYLGWICVATCANVASWLVGLGVPEDGTASTITTAAVLLVVVGLVAFLLSRTRQPVFRAALAAAVVWGLSWVSWGRFTGDLESTVVGYAAAFAALCVVGLLIVFLLPQRTRDDSQA